MPPILGARRAGWLVMACAVAAFLAIGIARSGEPRTADERELWVSQRLACPVCDGQSIAESQAISATQIKTRIAELVRAGQLSDDQIVRTIDASYAQDLALVPSGSGLDALIWVLPAVVAVLAVAGLATAFLRWRRPSGEHATDADRALVAQAMAGMAGATDAVGVEPTVEDER